MKPSQFNLLLPLPDGRVVLVNTFSGAVDLVSEPVSRYLSQTPASQEDEVAAYLAARRYLLEPELDEPGMVKVIYDRLLSEQRSSGSLLFIMLISFQCNLRCTYCWQQQNLPHPAGTREIMAPSLAAQAFQAIAEIMQTAVPQAGLPPRIQLFGGEPLLPQHESVVHEILRQSAARNWPTMVTTNGVFLRDYADLLHRYGVAEVQVTIDGPASVHDRRRLGSHYQELMDAIDLLLQAGRIVVKLRVNVDRSNVASLPALADDIIDRQWYSSRKFYAYLAPLRDSGGGDWTLIRERAQLLGEVLDSIKEQPKLGVFDFMGWDTYQAVLHFRSTGRWPLPRSYICDLNRGQFVFNPNGEIHLCLEEAHRSTTRVGRYSPELVFDRDAFSTWYDRSPLDLAYCTHCPLVPVCGGGCQRWVQDPAIMADYCQAARDAFAVGLTRAVLEGEIA